MTPDGLRAVSACGRKVPERWDITVAYVVISENIYCPSLSLDQDGHLYEVQGEGAAGAACETRSYRVCYVS